MHDIKKNEWDVSYENGDNHVFCPHEEVVRFASRFIRKRIGLNSFRDIAKNAAFMKVLDLGCGIGRHVIYLHELGLDVRGIDLSEEALKIAREWGGERGITGTKEVFLQGDIRALPWPNQYFSFAVSHGVLDSMPFVIARESVMDLSRAMTKGGLFYCDLISGDDSTHLPEYSGEEAVTTVHEKGTIQSYFNQARIDALVDGFFSIEEALIIRRHNIANGSYTSRYHLVLKNIQ